MINVKTNTLFYCLCFLYIFCLPSCQNPNGQTQYDSSTPCSHRADFVALWKVSRAIKVNVDVSKRQQSRHLQLDKEGQFVMEHRKLKNLTATSTVENEKMVFYNWESEFNIQNSFTGDWTYCPQKKELILDAKKFQLNSEAPIIDSIVSFPMQLKQLRNDSLTLSWEKFTILFTKVDSLSQ